MNAGLQFEHAGCRKGGRMILSDVGFCARAGEMVTVLGPSGSGKSTLLRVAVGLEELTEGTILFQNQDTRDWDITELRRRVGLVLQLPYLFAGTVRDNLLYGPRLHRRLDGDGKGFCHELMEQVGLPLELESRPSHELSVGQQMRVSLARTLANRPEILLLDEPTAALDGQSEKHILELILRLNQQHGYTILCVTHKIESAIQLGGRALLLDQGRLVKDGLVEEVISYTSASVWRNEESR